MFALFYVYFLQTCDNFRRKFLLFHLLIGALFNRSALNINYYWLDSQSQQSINGLIRPNAKLKCLYFIDILFDFEKSLSHFLSDDCSNTY